MRLHSNGTHSIRLAVVIALAGLCLPGPKAMADSYSGGAGTAENPYLISTSDDLVQLSRSSSDWESHFRMTKDIDMANVKGFRPIAPKQGSESPEFTGLFDGSGHVVSNLTINLRGQNCIGLFGCVGTNGLIKNLELKAVNNTGLNCVGGLVGTLHQGKIKSCSVQGSVIGKDSVGGLVGFNRNSEIDTSYATGDVAGEDSVGGLVGNNIESHITSCFSATRATGHFGVGGLVGINLRSQILSCYATSAVKGRAALGGLVGMNRAGSSQSKKNTDTSQKRSRKRDGLSSEKQVSVLSSFWDVDASGKDASDGGGTGLTTAELQKKATFEEAGWDFETVWVMPDSGYPQLRVMKPKREETEKTVPGVGK